MTEDLISDSTENKNRRAMKIRCRKTEAQVRNMLYGSNLKNLIGTSQ